MTVPRATQGGTYPMPVFDRMGETGWRVYLFAIAIGFLVMIEPAPTDLVFCIALGFVCFSRPRPGRFLSGGAITGIILYLLFSVLSLVFVQYVPMQALRAVVVEFYMIALFALTAYFVYHRGDEGFAKVLKMLTIGAVVASIIALVALLDLVPGSDIFFRGEGERNRVKSTFKDPNVYGPYLVPCILFVTWVAAESPRYRLLAFGALALLMTGLIFALSRGAWIHTAISMSILAIAFLVYYRTARPILIGMMVLAAAICIVLLIFIDQIVAQLADSLFARRLSLQSYDSNRFGHVARASQNIFEHPLGIGPVQARFIYGNLPHNTFIAFAMHNGIPASIGFGLIYAASMIRCAGKVLGQRPGWTKYAFVLAVLLGLLVLMQVVGAIHWRHLYLVCGLAFGVYKTDQLLIAQNFRLRHLSLDRVQMARPKVSL